MFTPLYEVDDLRYLLQAWVAKNLDSINGPGCAVPGLPGLEQSHSGLRAIPLRQRFDSKDVARAINELRRSPADLRCFTAALLNLVGQVPARDIARAFGLADASDAMRLIIIGRDRFMEELLSYG